MRICFRTYGCQMSKRDSEAAAAALQDRGYELVEDENRADVVIVNTCSVRDKAEAKALGKLGLLVTGKRERPWRRVGVMGCMVQRLKQEVFDKVPGLDFALGTHRQAALPGIVARVIEGEVPLLEAGEERLDPDAQSGHTQGGVTAYVNVLLGCSRGCAYCIVPAVRGAEWSRPAASVVDEVRRLAEAGVKEVTLLGQSVMRYGLTNPVWPGGQDSPLGLREPFPRLLEAVAGVEGIERVRFTSGHPSGCTAELARALGALPALCENIHLPLQSGSDRILRAMGRGYTRAEYSEAVQRLRQVVPELGVTTDIIVGFPGESIEDFETTRAFMEEIGFDNAFVFKYSPRPGTRAAAWRDDVDADEKLRRNKVLLADQERRGLRINERLVGRVLEVLVEGVSLRNSERWSGRTRTNKITVFAPAADTAPGDLAGVRISRARAQTLYGSLEV